MRLSERILDANKAPTAVDEFYPKRMIDELLDKGLDLLTKHTDNDGKLPSDLGSELCKFLMVSELDLNYDIAERAAKAQHVAEYKAISKQQKEEGSLGHATLIVKVTTPSPPYPYPSSVIGTHDSLPHPTAGTHREAYTMQQVREGARCLVLALAGRLAIRPRLQGGV